MKKVEYTGIGGETGFTNSLLIGKRIVVAQKDGIGRSIQIFGGTPTPKEFLYTNSTGGIDYGEIFVPFEPALVLYEDAEPGEVCIPVSLSALTLPDAFVTLAYNVSFFANGTAPFTLTDLIAPGWLSYNITGSTITLSGNPTVGDIAEDVPISFNVNNACGTVPVSDVIDVSPRERTLGFFVTTFSGVQIQVNLSQRINLDIGIQSTFADGFIAADCAGSASASVQLQSQVILAGGVNANDSNFPTGDWTTTNSYHIYNVLINNVARFNGDIVPMGPYLVEINFGGC